MGKEPSFFFLSSLSFAALKRHDGVKYLAREGRRPLLKLDLMVGCSHLPIDQQDQGICQHPLYEMHWVVNCYARKHEDIISNRHIPMHVDGWMIRESPKIIVINYELKGPPC